MEKIRRWMQQHSVIQYSRYVRDLIGAVILLTILFGVVLHQIWDYHIRQMKLTVIENIQTRDRLTYAAIQDYYSGQMSEPYKRALIHVNHRNDVIESINAIHRFLPQVMGPEYPFDVLDVIAIILVESEFNPNAISHKNAKGLMQLVDTKKYIKRIDGKRDPFDINCNIYGGLLCLKDKYDVWKDKEKAIMAYYGVIKKKDGTWSTCYLDKVSKTRSTIEDIIEEES